MPNREHVERFVRMVEAGEFVEAMEMYYADDATMQENNEPPRVGLPVLIAHERHNIETHGRAKACCMSLPVIDGDRVVIHWEFVFRSTGGAVVRIEELAQQNWRGDRLVTERFFYDPRQMRPAQAGG
jgi:hypothetical protein